MGGRQISVEKAECVWWLDYANTRGTLLIDYLVTQGLHPCPVNFRPEMMFCVEAVVEPGPVIELAVRAHAPGNRLVGIATVMAVIAVQI